MRPSVALPIDRDANRALDSGALLALGTSGVVEDSHRMTHVYRTKRILYYGALPRSYRP